MKNKDLIKKLKGLKETSIRKEFLSLLQGDLKKYMEFYPAREGSEIKLPKMSPFLGTLRLKIITLALIVVLVFSGGGVVFASQKSLPGDILYSVKTLAENLQEAFTFDSQKKAELEIKLSEKRIKEIEDIFKKEGINLEKFAVAERRLNQHLANAQRIIKKESVESKGNKFTEKNANELQNIEKKIKEYRNRFNLTIRTGDEYLEEEKENFNGIKEPDSAVILINDTGDSPDSTGNDVRNGVNVDVSGHADSDVMGGNDEDISNHINGGFKGGNN